MGNTGPCIDQCQWTLSTDPPDTRGESGKETLVMLSMTKMDNPVEVLCINPLNLQTILMT